MDTEIGRQLRINEERLRLAMEAGEIGLWDRDLVAEEIVWSDTLYDLLGRSHDAPVTVATFFEYIHEDDRPEVAKRAEKWLASGGEFKDEFRVVREDGELRWLKSRGRLYYDEEGKVVRAAGVNYDVTERKRAERSLRESERKYRIVADNTYDFEFWRDPEGRYVYVSPSCVNMTGYRPEEFIVDSSLMIRIVHPDDRPLFEGHLSDVESRRRTGELEFRVIRLGGGVRWISHVCQQVFGDGGEYLGVRGSNRDITGRKEAEAARRESEKQFATLFHHSPNFAFMSDAGTGEFFEVNGAYCDLVGYSRDELIGRSALDLGIVGPETRLELASGVRSGAHLEGLEIEVTRKDGERRTVLFSLEPITIFGRKMAICSGADVTGRKQAEKAMRKSEERLRLAASAAELGVFEWDARTDTPYWENDRMYEIFGRTREDGPLALEALHDEALAPEDRQMFKQAMAEAMRTEDLSSIDFRIRRRNDGRQRWVRCLSRFILAPDGPPQRLIGVIADVTESKQAEEALRESERRYRLLFDHNPDGVFAVDAAGKFIIVNPACAKISGYGAEELCQMTFMDLCAPDMLAKTAEHFDRNIRREGYAELETALIRKDGRRVDLWIVGEAIASDDGAVKVHCTVKDVSERKRVREELHRRLEELRAANEDLRRFNRAAVDREMRMIELKRQVNELLEEAGQKPCYKIPTD